VALWMIEGPAWLCAFLMRYCCAILLRDGRIYRPADNCWCYVDVVRFFWEKGDGFVCSLSYSCCSYSYLLVTGLALSTRRYLAHYQGYTSGL
jgi:hypothetical protein